MGWRGNARPDYALSGLAMGGIPYPGLHPGLSHDAPLGRLECGGSWHHFGESFFRLRHTQPQGCTLGYRMEPRWGGWKANGSWRHFGKALFHLRHAQHQGCTLVYRMMPRWGVWNANGSWRHFGESFFHLRHAQRQGYTLGYRMMPRWGAWHVAVHGVISARRFSTRSTLTSPLSNFGSSVSRRVARSRDSKMLS